MSQDLATKVLQHASSTTVSNKPWSDFKESDYSIEQWRRACLIAPAESSDSKDDYKLPVREPDGTLNKNAVHAAASVLAGGRGGVSATPEQKAAAKKKLVNLYRQIGETAPDSISGETKHTQSFAEDILVHHGVKGMKWGVRKAERNSPDVTIRTNPSKNRRVKVTGGKGHDIHEDAAKALRAKQKAKKSGKHALSNAELELLVRRMNLEQQLSRLSSPNKGEAQRFIEEQLKTIGRQKVQRLSATRANS